MTRRREQFKGLFGEVACKAITEYIVNSGGVYNMPSDKVIRDIACNVSSDMTKKREFLELTVEYTEDVDG